MLAIFRSITLSALMSAAQRATAEGVQSPEPFPFSRKNDVTESKTRSMPGIGLIAMRSKSSCVVIYIHPRFSSPTSAEIGTRTLS